MEKVFLMETLYDEEKKTIYTMFDAFIGKKKLKDALSNVLHDVKYHYQFYSKNNIRIHNILGLQACAAL